MHMTSDMKGSARNEGFIGAMRPDSPTASRTVSRVPPEPLMPISHPYVGLLLGRLGLSTGGCSSSSSVIGDLLLPMAGGAVADGDWRGLAEAAAGVCGVVLKAGDELSMADALGGLADRDESTS